MAERRSVTEQRTIVEWEVVSTVTYRVAFDGELPADVLAALAEEGESDEQAAENLVEWEEDRWEVDYEVSDRTVTSVTTGNLYLTGATPATTEPS